MSRRYSRTSPEVIAKQMIEDYPPHEPRRYEWAGGVYCGDVFYSWIQAEIKQHWGKHYPSRARTVKSYPTIAQHQ